MAKLKAQSLFLGVALISGLGVALIQRRCPDVMSSAIEPAPAMMASISQLPSGAERLAPTSTIYRCTLNLPLSERTGNTTICCLPSQKVRFDA
jgi:hypothetical protein